MHGCVGCASAVIRVLTFSHATQRTKYATHLYEHNTVVGGQSLSIMKCYYFFYIFIKTVDSFLLSFKQIYFLPCYSVLSCTASPRGCNAAAEMTAESSRRF